ncbi:MAG: bifunctional UDP-N-acetylglucosamine diphosphorylase/glucosamine-1-phosphate N-acetyltransferase GlmU [Ottowia sp.]|nr:bifunctional UDP-N-acetylglucosamine diphosphorylase/glucosamine-1-phosphate N-acetyltransferase GlmU [Ottowia sp.]
MLPLDIVILAAGQGTRMKSRRAKVLQPLAGQPLLAHVLAAVVPLTARSITVIAGHAAAQVQAFCDGWNAAHPQTAALRVVIQQPQRGTGHAVQQAAPYLEAEGADGVALVLNGDGPMLHTDTLCRLLALADSGALALLTVDTGADAGAYGRVLRVGDEVLAIREARDAAPEELAVTEWYSGVLAAPTDVLLNCLEMLDDNNAQHELYLTDVVRHARTLGARVQALCIDDAMQAEGVNTPAQLAALERFWQRRNAEALMKQGVRLADPARLDVRGTLRCGQDVEIDVGCVFEGDVHLGDDVRIGAHCCIANARIAAGARIAPFTHIAGDAAGVTVGEGAQVGPFARLRPGAQLGAEVHIGNFVEVKNSQLAAGAKANHLAYLGDASVGARVNYGAGCITANYDGAYKHRTTIGDDVHIGSNTTLVAPVRVGAGATVGAGSAITRDVPDGALAVTRAPRKVLEGWQRPKKG